MCSQILEAAPIQFEWNLNAYLSMSFVLFLPNWFEFIGRNDKAEKLEHEQKSRGEGKEFNK